MKLSQEAKNMIAMTALIGAIILALNLVVSPAGVGISIPWSIGLLAVAVFFWIWMRRDALAEKSAAAAKAAEDAATAAEDLAQRNEAKTEAPGAQVAVETAATAEPDDLTVINGIGAVFAEVLKGAGITTFSQLAGLSEDELLAIIQASGRNRPPLLETWLPQAELAAMGDWEGLRRLQDA